MTFMVDERISKRLILAQSSFALSRGFSFDEVVEATGLSAAELLNPQGTVPAAALIGLSLTLHARLKDVFLPLAQAVELGPSAMSILLPSLRTAPTAGDALRFLEMNSSHFGTGFELRLESTPTRTAWVMSHPKDPLDGGIGNESGAMTIMAMLRSLAKTPFSPSEIHFPYAAKAPAREYRNFFDAPIAFEKSVSQTTIVFDREALETPLQDADPVYYGAVLARAGLEKGIKPVPPLERLRNSMVACAREGRFGLEAAARHAGMSVRTAQRVAARSGTSPSRMLDEVRAGTMRGMLLRDPDLPMAVLAERLDYSDERSLRRAFKRLTGQSPREYRTQLRLS
ncbi:MAG: AraC family transcriptional regulator ligand-binding domain-containing protein [Myxococcota bacterium]